MSKIRVNQLCKQFNVAPEELVAFLQTQGKTIEPIPNAKVPDSYIHALQKQFGTDDNPKDGAKDVSSHSKEPIVQVPQQGKAQLITDLCNRSEVPLENLAQTVGQPQWLIDSTMQGKITNDVTVAAIVGRLLQIYRKKLDCELKDAEKATLVSREQLKQWESGQKIDFDRLEGYLDNLAKYAKIRKEMPAPSGKILAQSNVENKPIKGADKSKKKSKSTKSKKRKIDWGLYEVSVYAKEQKERQNRQKEWEESRKKALELMAGARQLPEAPKLYPEPSFLKEANEKYERGKIIESLKEVPSSDPHKRFGKLIWDMMQYIVRHINYRKLTTDLADKGFNTEALLSMRDGLYDDIDGYKIVAAYCLNLIGTERAVSKKSWPIGADMSYTVYRYITENPTGANTTLERCEVLFPFLKNYKPDYRPKSSRRRNSHGNTGGPISTEGQSVRHRSYSSDRGGFDYGITDT